MADLNHFLSKIKDSLDRGEQLKFLLPALAKWMKSELKKDVDIYEIADKLTDANIPTVSGRGRWRVDTIKYLLNYF